MPMCFIIADTADTFTNTASLVRYASLTSRSKYPSLLSPNCYRVFKPRDSLCFAEAAQLSYPPSRPIPTRSFPTPRFDTDPLSIDKYHVPFAVSNSFLRGCSQPCAPPPSVPDSQSQFDVDNKHRCNHTGTEVVHPSRATLPRFPPFRFPVPHPFTCSACSRCYIGFPPPFPGAGRFRRGRTCHSGSSSESDGEW